MKRKVMYCVMVNDSMYGDSLSDTKAGASSYLLDAQHAANSTAEQTGRRLRVYVARVVITKVKPTKYEDE